jgi:hypothetical protein
VPQDVRYVGFTGSVFWSGHVGLTLRFAGLLLGLSAVCLLWLKQWPFVRLKLFVAFALFLEGAYFVGLLPSVFWLIRPETFVYSPELGYGYLLQILFTVPFLWLLAFTVVQYREGQIKRGLVVAAALAFVGYVAALAINEVSRWTGMLSGDASSFLSQGIRAVGFLNAVVLMPVAVSLTVVGVVWLVRRDLRSAKLWLGASLFAIGLNYAIYFVYSYLTNSLQSVMLVDVWTIPLIGLGVALMVNSFRRNSSQQ